MPLRFVSVVLFLFAIVQHPNFGSRVLEFVLVTPDPGTSALEDRTSVKCPCAITSGKRTTLTTPPDWNSAAVLVLDHGSYPRRGR